MHDNPGLDVSVEDQAGGLIARYVVVAEVVEPDGTESPRVRASPGLAIWSAMGMLHFALALQAPARD